MSDTIFSPPKKKIQNSCPSPQKHLNHFLISFGKQSNAKIIFVYFLYFMHVSLSTPIYEDTSSLCVALAITDFTCVMLCDDKLRMVFQTNEMSIKKVSVHSLFLTLPLLSTLAETSDMCQKCERAMHQRRFDIGIVVKIPRVSLIGCVETCFR